MIYRPITYLVALLLSLTQLTNLAAQNTDWALFPTNQRTFWRTDTVLRMHYCDSVATNGATSTHYFGANYYMGYATNPCWDTVMAQYLQGAPFPLTTCTSQSGVWTLDAGNGQSLAFDTWATAGTSWEVPLAGTGFSKLRFTCTSIGEQAILGGTDSVKYFIINTLDATGQVVSTPLTGTEYRLSKAHGLLQYTPFEQLTQAAQDYFLLYGYRKNGQRHGFTNDFLDYFGHYNGGQVYKFFTKEWTGKPHEITQRDSITAAVITADSVTITATFSRSRASGTLIGVPPNAYYDWDTTYANGTYSRTINSYDFPQLNYTPNYFHLPTDTKVHRQRLGQHDDWLLSWEWDGSGVYSNGNACLSHIVDEYIGPKVVSSKYGLFYQNQIKQGPPRYYELLGYKDNTSAWGNYDRIVSVADVPDLSDLVTLYPQPANDELRMELPTALIGKELNYRIFSMQGQAAGSGTVAHNALKINDLPAGMYVLMLRGEAGAVVKQFVKM